MRTTRTLIAALFLALLAGAPAAACRSSKTNQAPALRVPTTVRVENQGFADMVIYVIGTSGERRRLGTATGSSTRVFTIPQDLIFGGTALRFMADPIGGSRTPVSEQIVVQPGDQVTLTIPPS